MLVSLFEPGLAKTAKLLMSVDMPVIPPLHSAVQLPLDTSGDLLQGYRVFDITFRYDGGWFCNIMLHRNP